MSENDNDKENNSMKRSNIFSDTIIRANLIRSIWFFNIPPSVFYLNALDKQKSLSIIDSIFGQPPPIQCKRNIAELQYDWLAHCLRKLVAPEEPTKFDEFKLFLTYLSKSRGNYVTNIKRFLSIRLSRVKSFYNNNGNSAKPNTAFFDSEGDEIIIFQALFDLYTEEPSLFYSLSQCRYNRIQDTFTTSNLNENEKTDSQPLALLPDHFIFPESEARLIAKLGNRLFQLCPSLSPIFLRALKNEDLEALFGLPCVYSDPKCVESSIQFQRAFFSIRRFPLVSFFANSNILIALCNTSAVTDQHFSDLFLKPSIEFLNRSEFEEAFKICSNFSEMFDYVSLLVMEKEKKSDDLNFMTNIVNFHFEGLSSASGPITPSNSIMLQSDSFSSLPLCANSTELSTFSEPISVELMNKLFQRFKGDVCVIDDVKNYLGTITSLSKLREESIPKIFVSFLKIENFEPFETMKNRILFSVSDEDWIRDGDFVSGYFAIVNTMKVIELNDEAYFEVIEFFIRQIQSLDFLNKLSIDIFSLLFLTKKKEENDEKEDFFVNRETAERILRILIDSDNSDDQNNTLLPYLSSALSKIQFANVLYPDKPTVRALMEPAEGMFALALEKKEIGIFGKIAHSTEKEGRKNNLKEIVDVAKQVVQFQQKSSDDKNKFNDLTNNSKIEIICSFEISQNEMKKLFSELNFESLKYSDYLRILLTNKQNIFKSSIELLQLPFVRLVSSNFFHSVSERLLLSSLENRRSWIPLLTNESINLIEEKSSLYSFLFNLDTLIPPLLQATNETVAKCLDFDPLIAVPQLVNEGKIEQASSLSNSLGYSVIEAIIKSGSTSSQCLHLLAEENPAISSCMALNSNMKRDEISDELLGNSHALSSLISRNDDKEFESIEDIQDNNNQNGASIDEIHSAIISMLKKRPIPVSPLSDILFRITEDDFINVIMNSKVLFNFDDSGLNSLLKLCDLNCFEKFAKTVENFIYISRTTNRKPFPLEESFYALIMNSVYDKNSLSVAQQVYESCHLYFNSNETVKKSIIELSKLKKFDEINRIIKFDESKLRDILPDEINELIFSSFESNKSKKSGNSSIDFDDSTFFDSVPNWWNLMETPIQTIIANASDKSNVLHLIALFPSIREPFIDRMFSVVSKQAEFNDLPIDKRAFSVSNNIRSFLPLIDDEDQKIKLIDLAVKQLVLMASQLSVYDSHSEWICFKSLKGISASMNIIQKESARNLTKTRENDESKANFGRINAALHFVGCFPCTKFNTNYSFNKFENHETGEKIMKICFQIDLLQNASEIHEAWRITSYENCRDYYAINCVKLGIDKIPRKNKYKGFPMTEKTIEKNSNNDDEVDSEIFSIWKFATDRKKLDTSHCTCEDSCNIVREFIDAYRHRSFYDSRICGRLTNLNEVDSIVETEFQTNDTISPQESVYKDEQQPTNNNVGIARTASLFQKLFKSKQKLFQSSTASFDINTYVDDDGELCNQHFYSRLNHLCVANLSSESSCVLNENRPSDYISSELSEVLTMYDHPSSEMTETLFPGTPAQLSSYLSARAPFFEEARYHSYIGEFATSMTIFDENLSGKEESQQNKWNCFVEDILVPAIQRGRTGSFFSSARDFLRIKKDDESQIRSMINELFETSQKVDKMPFTLLMSTVALERVELAAYEAVDAFKSSSTCECRLFALDVSFASAATFVQGGQIESSIENSESIEKLRSELRLESEDGTSKSMMFELMKIISIQRKFCESVDGGGLSIFDGSASINRMTAFLLFQKEFIFAVELMGICSKFVKKSSVAFILVDMLAVVSDEKIQSVVSGMESEAPMSLFRAVIAPMVNRALFFIKDERLAAVIVDTVKTMKIKCPLLILADRLDEALKVAAEDAPEFLPLIANYAARENKLQVYNEAVRTYEKGK